MAIYCIQCGTNLPDDAIFCMKCGKQLKGGSSSSATSSSSASKSGEVEIFSIEVKSLFKDLGEYGWDTHYGCTCTVTNRRLIFQTKKGGTFHIYLRDIEGVSSERDGIIFKSYIVRLHGYGHVFCKNEGDNDKLASAIKQAML